MSTLRNFSITLGLVVTLWSILVASQADQDFLIRNLPGEWKEDNGQREGLSEFIDAVGLGWLEQIFVKTLPFSNEQIIGYDEDRNAFKVKTINGPLKQETEFVLHLDGTTVGEVDLDKLGGKTSATSKIVSETTLMSYLKKPDSQEIFVTANRTLYPDIPGKMTYTTIHVPSEKKLVSQYYKN